MYFILAKASFSVCQPKTLQFKISSQQVSIDGVNQTVQLAHPKVEIFQ